MRLREYEMNVKELDDGELVALLRKHGMVVPVGPTGWKLAGNTLLGKKEVEGAVAAYSRGLGEGTDDKSLRCILLSNRAQAYLALQAPILALIDVEAALQADPTYAKSYFRKGKALLELERYEEAAEAFRLAGDGQEKMISLCLERTRQRDAGEYDWKTLLTSSFSQPECIHEVANFKHSSVALVHDLPDGRGRGLVAKEAIAAGTLLLVERAALLVFPSQVAAKRKHPAELAVAETQVRIANAGSSKFASRLSDLYRYDPNSLVEVIVSNGFAWWDSTKCNLVQRPQDHGFGLWFEAAMLNHSCVPNACYGFLGNLLVVRAVSNIAVNEEITISYVSMHDSVEDRAKKLTRRGFTCQCQLCARQRDCISSELNSGMHHLAMDPQHGTLFYHGVEQLADKCNDFQVSAIVVRVMAALSCDQKQDYRPVVDLLELAYTKQSAEPLLAAAWTEDVNICVQAMFAAMVTQRPDVAEKWVPRLDESLGKFYPKEIVEAVGNGILMAYRMQKMQEEQAKRNPGMGMMGL